MSGYKTSFCSNVISLVAETLDSILLNYKIKGIFEPYLFTLFFAMSHFPSSCSGDWWVFFFYFCFILFFCLGKKGRAPKPGVFKVFWFSPDITPGLNHPGPHLLGRRVPCVTPVWPAEFTAAAWQVNEKESQNLRVMGRYSTLLLCLVTISGSCDATPLAPSLTGVTLHNHMVGAKHCPQGWRQFVATVFLAHTKWQTRWLLGNLDPCLLAKGRPHLSLSGGLQFHPHPMENVWVYGQCKVW